MSVLEQLTEKQQKFVVEYAADMDRIRAIKEAGYSGSDKTLSVRACKLLSDPKIQAALAEIGTKLDAAMLTVDNLARQLARFIFRDFCDLVDDQGFLKVPLDQLPDDVRQCIDGVDTEYDYDRKGNVTRKRVKLRFVGKIKAVELAMKWRQMLAPNTLVQNNTQINLNWQEFYQDPPKVVDERMQKALEG